MILKGKYYLNITSVTSGGAQFDVTYTKGDIQFTSLIIEGTGLDTKVHGFCTLTALDHVHGTYTNANGAEYDNVGRVFDFGDTAQDITNSASELLFNKVFIPLAEGEFVSEPNLAQVTNKIMDKLLAEAIAKIEKCKPTLTTVLNNTSGATSLSASINNYDLLFLRATTYTGSSYTPLCYVIPAKMMFSSDFGVGSSGNFLVQVADNSKYTNFKATASGLTRSAGSSSSYPGKIYQVYGLKFPTGVN